MPKNTVRNGGIKLDGEGTEFANIDDLSAPKIQTSDNKNNYLSIVEAWYKDKDGDICVITWINDEIIRDVPKFFYKRDEQGKLIEFDEIEIEQPPLDDGMGNLIPQPPQMVRVPVHVPKRFPFVIQYNVPKEKSYYGKADPDIIYDQQEAIKKVLSSHEQKLIKGQSKIFVRKGENLTTKINDAELQIIEVEDPNTSVKVVDMKTPTKGYFNIISNSQAAKMLWA